MPSVALAVQHKQHLSFSNYNKTCPSSLPTLIANSKHCEHLNIDYNVLSRRNFHQVKQTELLSGGILLTNCADSDAAAAIFALCSCLCLQKCTCVRSEVVQLWGHQRLTNRCFVWTSYQEVVAPKVCNWDIINRANTTTLQNN